MLCFFSIFLWNINIVCVPGTHTILAQFDPRDAGFPKIRTWSYDICNEINVMFASTLESVLFLQCC
ncbi:hypothetical protein BJ095_12328 [Ureibacillus chungkukjangi]|uniref:Uncharacterized protein n=1 Tax=Ureibacillus chungkukjangi TaxID=1202712 RepID=A0A318TXG1_9BACL|nr:hypothetical protein BJ095_12328 [Ureibacillus chungkukjangi]